MANKREAKAVRKDPPTQFKYIVTVPCNTRLTGNEKRDRYYKAGTPIVLPNPIRKTALHLVTPANDAARDVIDRVYDIKNSDIGVLRALSSMGELNAIELKQQVEEAYDAKISSTDPEKIISKLVELRSATPEPRRKVGVDDEDII